MESIDGLDGNKLGSFADNTAAQIAKNERLFKEAIPERCAGCLKARYVAGQLAPIFLKACTRVDLLQPSITAYFEQCEDGPKITGEGHCSTKKRGCNHPEFSEAEVNDDLALLFLPANKVQ